MLVECGLVFNNGFQGLASFVEIANRSTVDNATINRVTGDLQKTMGLSQDEVQKSLANEPGTVNKNPDAIEPGGTPSMKQWQNNDGDVGNISDPSHPNNKALD